MKKCLDRREAFNLVKKKIKECLDALESTAFLFHHYKEDDEKNISNVCIEHLQAMSRKIVEAFDQKSEQIQDFVIIYESIKAVMVAIDEAVKKQSGSCLVSV